MNYITQQQSQGTYRKYIRLFVSTEQTKFIATVDASESNLSEQIANSYACTCEQLKSETGSNRYIVSNIRQNGFTVIIPKELNIGQVLNDQSYITCKICKAQNKNKLIKKALKEQLKIQINLPDFSPTSNQVLNNILIQENKEQNIEESKKKNNKKRKKKNQQVQNKQQEIIDSTLNEKPQCISQSKEQDKVQNIKNQSQLKENIEKQKSIDNIYCDVFTSSNSLDDKVLENVNQHDSKLEAIKDEEKNDQSLIKEQKFQEKSQVNNKQNMNKVVTTNNLLLKDTLDYFQESLNTSKELPRAPNCSFQTNIQHSTRLYKQKQNQNNLKQSQSNDKIQCNQKKNQIYQSINQSNQSNNNNRNNKRKGKNNI